MNIVRLKVVALAIVVYAAIVPLNAPAAEVKDVVFKRTEQQELKLAIHFPPDWKASDKRPAIVFFFGGGWVAGSPNQFLPQAEYFASRGLVAVRADYRIKISPIECVEDARSAVRWLREHAKELGLDPDRLVASGGSAGGHLAAIVSMADGEAATGEDKKISSRPNLMILFNPVLDMEHENAAKTLTAAQRKSISPLQHLGKDTAPAILFYGETDGFLKQGQEFVARSKTLGSEAKLFVAPRMGHGFFNGQPWRNITLREADQFLIAHKYLTGEPSIKATDGNLKLVPRE